MSIKIAQRLRPFTHKPGAFCPVPGTMHAIQVFPALVRVFDASEGALKLIEEYPLPIKGPVTEFTVQLDLEKGKVMVWGKEEKGFFRYSVQKGEKGVAFNVEKGDLPLPKSIIAPVSIPTERLSLGSHKKQEWDSFAKGPDLATLLPHWFRLGQMTPELPGSFCDKDLRSLFLAGFENLWMPRLNDTDFQGIEINLGENRSLLAQGAKIIRDLFIRQEGDTIHLLPALSPEFHAGRMTGIQLAAIGTLNMEWSRGELQCVEIHPSFSKEIKLIFPSWVKRFRIGRKKWASKDDCIALQQGMPLFLDRFEA